MIVKVESEFGNKIFHSFIWQTFVMSSFLIPKLYKYILDWCSSLVSCNVSLESCVVLWISRSKLRNSLRQYWWDCWRDTHLEWRKGEYFWCSSYGLSTTSHTVYRTSEYDMKISCEAVMCSRFSTMRAKIEYAKCIHIPIRYVISLSLFRLITLYLNNKNTFILLVCVDISYLLLYK